MKMKQLEWRRDFDSPRAEAMMFDAAEGHTIRRLAASDKSGWAFECTCGWRAVHHSDRPAERHAKQVAPKPEPKPDPGRPTIFNLLRRLGRLK